MYRILKCDADAYINNRIIKGKSRERSNTGVAGTIDLFKIYNTTSSEYSRGLIHFDLRTLKEVVNNGEVDINHESFFARLKLSDVYGGQTTPNNFTIQINALSASFEEGLGKDIVGYEDFDTVNFITASKDYYTGVFSPWNSRGCSSSGSIGTHCDFFTGSHAQVEQFFKKGDEDLDVDVTPMVKKILTGEIPDAGFRVSFPVALEGNSETYFVKRFASRHAFDESKRPKLVWGFDDSIKDTSEFLYTDTNTSFTLYNYDNGDLKNLRDLGGEILGPNCILLKLTIPPSGTYYFTGSQYSQGNVVKTGIYVATGSIPLDERYELATEISGSKLRAACSWTNLSKTKVFASPPEKLVLKKPAFDHKIFSRKFVVSSLTKGNYGLDENSLVRVNVFDPESPAIVTSRVAVPSPSGYQGVISDACYQIRCSETNEIVIPFDFEKGSTRLSSDNRGMFFILNTSSLYPEMLYVIDVALKCAGDIQVYRSVSPVFKVTNLQ